MTAMIFFASNYKPVYNFDAEYQEIILGVTQGLATKKGIAKFFHNSQDEE